MGKTSKAIALITLLLFAFSPLLLAQEEKTPDPGTISGRILDEQTPAEFTNILLLTASDSAVLKLELADESGRFSFINVPAADYFIRTTGIG